MSLILYTKRNRILPHVYVIPDCECDCQHANTCCIRMTSRNLLPHCNWSGIKLRCVFRRRCVYFVLSLMMPLWAIDQDFKVILQSLQWNAGFVVSWVVSWICPKRLVATGLQKAHDFSIFHQLLIQLNHWCYRDVDKGKCIGIFTRPNLY